MEGTRAERSNLGHIEYRWENRLKGASGKLDGLFERAGEISRRSGFTEENEIVAKTSKSILLVTSVVSKYLHRVQVNEDFARAGAVFGADDSAVFEIFHQTGSSVVSNSQSPLEHGRRGPFGGTEHV